MKIDQNTVALVTGGASGLGEATVRILVSQGASVFIADFDDEKGNNLSKELGNKTKFFKTNVTDETNVENLIIDIEKTFGKLHIVVNSAGVASAGLILTAKGMSIPTKELLRVLNINVVGTFNVVKHAAKLMSKNQNDEYNQKGVIVNVSSVAGIEGQKGQTVYSASKGAIIGMTLPLARDLGKFGIRVVTIAPGLFETPMGAGINDKVKLGLSSGTCLDRFGQPQEFAECVVGLCTNSYITGEVIRLDGGIRFPKM